MVTLSLPAPSYAQILQHMARFEYVTADNLPAHLECSFGRAMQVLNTLDEWEYIDRLVRSPATRFFLTKKGKAYVQSHPAPSAD